MGKYRPRRVTNLSKAEMMPDGPFPEPPETVTRVDYEALRLEFQNQVALLREESRKESATLAAASDRAMIASS